MDRTVVESTAPSGILRKSNRNRSLLSAMAAALLVASAAEAKVIEGPMVHGNGNDYYHCTIVNLSEKKAVEISIEVWDHDSLINNPQDHTYTVQPLSGASLLAGWGSAGYRRCRFVVPGSTKGYAASMGTGPSLHTPQAVFQIK